MLRSLGVPSVLTLLVAGHLSAQVLTTYNFADGGLDGWVPFGSPTLTNVVPPILDPNHDTRSLLVTNRTAGFMGPALNLLSVPGVAAGGTYSVTAYVLLAAPDSNNPTATLTTKLTNCANTSGVFANLATSGALSSTAWTQVQGSFSFSNLPGPPTSLTLFIQSSSATDSFYIDSVTITETAPPPASLNRQDTIQTNIPSIFQTFSYYFPIGAGIDTNDLSGPHEQLLIKHFNSLTSMNDMTWSAVEPTKGTFAFTAADNEIGLAVCNDMKARGHALVSASGAQTPSYAFGDGTNSPANQALVTANIQEHIQSEVEHFGSKVYAWDVVNEPIDPTQPDCLAHGPFYQVLGKSYIDVAFQAARQFAPAGTQLFLNDSGTTIPNRLACLVQVAQDLTSRGIPLDGIGHEMHNNINFPSAASMVNAIDTVANSFANLKQEITEMDVSVYNAGDNHSNYGANGGTVPASIIAEQGYLYARYFNALRQLKGKLQAVTFWGIADDDTWLDSFPIPRLDAPLPFDTALQAKPAYWGMVEPTQLPGWGLTFKVVSKTGIVGGPRVWTITATNPSTAPAYGTQITGFTLTQTGGAACTPVIIPPSSFPVSLGDVPGGSTANAPFTIDFTGCSSTARFTLSMPWNSAVYDTGTFVSGNQFQ